MVTRKLALVALATLCWSASASAAVVSSLPGGVSLVIPASNLTSESGPLMVQPGVMFASTVPSVFGFTADYGFNTNGSWTGTPMIGLDNSVGVFELAFDAPISGFLGELNWTVDNQSNASIAIYDANFLQLEILTLEDGSNLVAPGYWGFSRPTSDISYVRFTNEFIGVRNITIAGAVPDVQTWAMLIAGFGLVGAAARRRRSAVAA